MPPHLGLFCQSSLPSRHEYAKSLAQQLHLPLLTHNPSDFPYLLLVTDTHLQLQQTTTHTKPIYVDFLSGASSYRRYQGGGKNQLIARAVGIKAGYKPTVIDATAGLGGDGFVLACLGCKVHYLERSPIVAALLQDGLDRLFSQPEIPPDPPLKKGGNSPQCKGRKLPPFFKGGSGGISGVATTLTLTTTNAIDYLTQLPEAQYPDVIYLDPMFPTQNKTALVKKEMRMLRDIVGYDTDTTALLNIALQRSKKRVVVKRPRLAPIIDVNRPPDLVFNGQSCRFDVYLAAILNPK